MTELELSGDAPDDQGPATQAIPIGGKTIVIRALLPAQMLQMQHEARLMESSMVDTTRKIKSLERVHRGLLSTIVQDSDRDFVEDLMIDGKIELEDLMNAVLDLTGAPSPEKKPKVRRGRTR
jgi:hypothetical protein